MFASHQYCLLLCGQCVQTKHKKVRSAFKVLCSSQCWSYRKERFWNTLLGWYATRRSFWPVAKAVSCFLWGLDTQRSRSLCPACNASCHFCGKQGQFARVCRSKGSSNDVASAAITAPVPSVSRLFLASASLTLRSTVAPGTLHDSPA